jgi:hypothetical protein
MMAIGDTRPDRAIAALGSLSTVGAALAGLGVGVIFANRLTAVAWLAVAAGVVVHLFGMMGAMRARSHQGYRPSPVETAGYWSCWAVIFGLAVYGVVELSQ